MLLVGWALAAELVEVPGTGVSLEPPEGWAVATQWPGFVDLNTGSSILVMGDGVGVNEVIALVPTVDAARAVFRSQGIEVATRTEFRAASGQACLLVSGTQRAGELVVDKWLAMCGGPGPAMVTLQAPQSAAFPREQAEAALRSMHLASPPGLDAKLAALPFAITPVAPFRISPLSVGTGLLLLGGPLDTDPTHTQPNVIVASQVGGAPLDPASDPCAVGRQFLDKSAKLPGAIVSRQNTAQVAGRAGCLLAGTYTGPSGAERAFLQYLVIPPTGYTLRLVAIGAPERLAPLEPQVAAMAAAVVIK